MRYSVEHKKETHERIVKAAARQFRRSGRYGISIADLMSKLKLTHGGFYRHFASKEQLFVEAFEKGLEEIRTRMKRAADTHPGNELKAIIEEYLSLEHCSNPADGCHMAALASEVSRCPKSVRSKIDRALSHHISEVAKFLPGSTEAERLSNAMVLGSGMIGVVAMARSVTDEHMRTNILEAAKKFYFDAFCRN
jgi:TetR/AcrR family transcriptional repressor of nem operon